MQLFGAIGTLPHGGHTSMEAESLHAQPTRLIGRASEVAAIRQCLIDDDVRLVSLIGPAGVGKTRLALEIQREPAGTFSQSAAFIDLSALREPASVPTAIAESLGLVGGAAEMLPERVQQHLSTRIMLLVLDNFEHVMPAASFIADLLATCPLIKILVTSREPLRLRWEHTLLISPLTVPDLEHLPGIEILAQIPAVALLLHRIRARNPQFALTEDDAPVVAELCVALDGLPLALELAAARTPYLSLHAILGRLQDRLHLLHWNAVDLPDRHRSLSAAITWSYELLPEQEQRLFRALGVFAGGIALEAVESVARQSPSDVAVFDGMLSLAERSLVHPETRPDTGVRFRLLESMREYAGEELARAGELTDVRTRHAAYFLALAERAESRLYGAGQQSWIERLEDEHGNLRSALQWLGECGDGNGQLRLASALGYFWWLRGYAGEGRRWLGEGLERAPNASISLRARGACWLATLLLAVGDLEPVEALLGDALAGARMANNHALIGLALAGLGRLALLQGDARSSTRILEQSLEAYAVVQHRWGTASTKVSLGVAGLASGEEDAAIGHLEDSITLSRKAGDERTRARAMVVLAAILARRGDQRRAVSMLQECIELSMDVEDRRLLHTCLEALVGLAADQVRPDQAARLLGAEDALARMTGSSKSLLATTYAARSAEALVGRLSTCELQSQFVAGQQLMVRQIADMAVQLLETVSHKESGPDVLATQPSGGIGLSQREREVLALVAAGHSDKEIAQVLFIGERTVRYHLTSIFNKLGADNRPQAVLLAARRGLV